MLLPHPDGHVFTVGAEQEGERAREGYPIKWNACEIHQAHERVYKKTQPQRAEIIEHASLLPL